VVYLIDVNEGICPHRKALLESDIAEERRMFYVGMTRAKERLKIFSIKEHYSQKIEVSRFVGEVLISQEDLTIGVRVWHVKYKEGIIQKVDGDKVIISFSKANKLLTLSIRYCISNKIIEIIKE